jgi:membrane protease subunit HflK
MHSVLGSTRMVLVDQKGGNSLLYLPLDQLLKQAGAAAASTDAARAAAPPPDAAIPIDPARARELPRGRERGDSR